MKGFSLAPSYSSTVDVRLPGPGSRSSAVRAALVAAAAVLTALVLGGTAPEAATAPRSGGDPGCREGRFCAWAEESFTGRPHRIAADAVDFESCIPLPEGLEAKSFANRTHQPVTTYQDPNCDTAADFSTHPPGSRVPEAPYVVRAVQIWHR